MHHDGLGAELFGGAHAALQFAHRLAPQTRWEISRHGACTDSTGTR